MTDGESISNSLSWLVEDLSYHQVRVLLLVQAVSSTSGHARKLDGLTKLAKLDFLVRYPALAPLILDQLADGNGQMHLSDSEITAPTEVEDPMIRYRYGPWDDRYYSVVGALVSRGLVKYVKGKQGGVALVPTLEGTMFATEMAADPLWRTIADRCRAIAAASIGMTGNTLKTLIYDRLADLMDRPYREVIS